MAHLLLPLILSGCLAPQHGATEPARPSLLDFVRAAVGQQDPDFGQFSLVLLGTARYSGCEAEFELTFGRWGTFCSVVTGPRSTHTHYDGLDAWRGEDGSPPWPLELYLREEALLTTWVRTNQWLRELDDLVVEEVPAKQNGERALQLSIEDGGLSAYLAIDSESLLPIRLEIPGEHGGVEVRLDDWRIVGGERLAHRVTERSYGFLENEYVLETTEPVPGHVRAALIGEPPERPPDDYAFDEAVSSEVPVRRADTGHLFVRPLVDGEDVGWFLFDSGAGVTLIDAEVADRLGMGAYGASALSGMGPTPSRTRFRRAEEVRLGPLVFGDLAFLERTGRSMASRILGEPVVGVLGWDVLLRARVTVDAEVPSLRIEPSDAPPPDGVEWAPLTLHWQVPYVEASFEGGEGLFCLDTGAGSKSVIFHHRAVTELGLADDRELVPFTGGGAGGEVPMAHAELDWFEVAGRRTEPAPVILSLGEDGESDPYALGFLGGAFLEPFRIVFDYPNRRVGFVRR